MRQPCLIERGIWRNTWRALAAALLLSAPAAAQERPYFEIEVLDEATGRGVPLVELTTTHHLRFVTDSAGRIAFHEPELMGKEVFFDVRSHGYEVAKDGFGVAGARLTPRAGANGVVKIKRRNIAERLYRVTGEGVYRDSLLLGHEAPLNLSALRAGIVGQDSVQVAPYGGKLYWFWGDTTPARYPLGNFRTAGATSPPPGEPGAQPEQGIALEYFATREGQARQMIPLDDDPAAKEGVVWIDGLTTVTDSAGRERLVCRYERRRGLEKRLDMGIAVWNDERERFETAARLAIDESRMLLGHPTRHTENGATYLLCGLAYPTLRVKATLEDVGDPSRYEAFSCQNAAGEIVRDDAGRPVFAWRVGAAAWTPKLDQRLAEEHRLLRPRDVETGREVLLHGGSVRWNAHRRRWIAIGVQEGGTSYLGEVWYSEADAPTGPWRSAVKIATHEKYSFYNPVHHDFFDAEGGKVVYFEGTYSHTFSGNQSPTPRYDYNQVMYRLDLDEPRLKKARE